MLVPVQNYGLHRSQRLFGVCMWVRVVGLHKFGGDYLECELKHI